MSMDRVKKFIKFFRDVLRDSRVPSRDRTLMIIFLILVISPLDIIPEWIPVFGIIDDFILIAIMLDFLFEYLDRSLVLSYYPFSLKSFNFIRKIASIFTRFAPKALRRKIWKYRPNIY